MALTAGFVALSTISAPPAHAASSPEALAVRQVVPGIFVHRGLHEEATPGNVGGIANIGFIVGRDSVGVIDTGGSFQEGQALLAAIRRITDLPIRYVINTHFHPDHVLGNAAFVGQATEFVAHERLPRALAARGNSYLRHLNEALGVAAEGTRIVQPEHLIVKQQTIDLGGRQLLLTAYPPAHTDADLTVLDLETRTLFAGDLVFLERIPVVDGSILGWLKVIGQLKGIEADRVVPGHGPPVADWPSAILDEERYLDLIVHRTREILSSGGSLEQAVRQAGTEERARWLLFDDYNARNVAAAYTELEWE
ncbi:MAG TPA: quinoprotein relay system zinc metallohydrolase 2 [Ferrovibrio sp.]|uniref:quinoprotein relay system zinc metallohydrolase 2 n=1 Tax=Ferrovibrio sp. TaxID=1917215 RepID=UPI002ED58F7B